MVIFHSYVNLPEGKNPHVWWALACPIIQICVPMVFHPHAENHRIWGGSVAFEQVGSFFVSEKTSYAKKHMEHG